MFWSQNTKFHKTIAMKTDKTKNLLVVDDDIVSVNIAKSYFESKGYHVDFAINGSQAIRMLPGSHYELIILDYNMPLLNGLEFLEILHKNQFTNRVNIIMLTGESNELLTQKAIALGAKKVLNKNNVPENVFAEISQFLS